MAPFARAGSRPSPPARATCRPCPTSRPSPTTPRCRQGRRRSAASRPRCPAPRSSVVFGSRSASAPKMTASASDRRKRLLPVASRSVAHARRFRRQTACSAASPPRRTRRSPRTFSVPARRPRSCPPPRMSGIADMVMLVGAARARRRPAGRRACARKATGHRRRAPRVEHRMRPSRLHGVANSAPPAACTSAARLGDRLDDAGLVIGAPGAREAAARRRS